MIGIISDIHGNHVALSAVIEKLNQMGVTDIVCLGDIGGYYCQVNECCEELQSRNIFSLMGNHDWYLTSGQGCPRSNSANRCLDYQRNIISDANKEWLMSLTPQAKKYAVDIVHGGWNDPLDEYIFPTSDYFSHPDGILFASGHTHIPHILKNENFTYCNPGSVGQPRDGDFRASFAILDKDVFSLHRVPYDFRKVQAKMKKAGFPPYYYENLALGLRIGSNKTQSKQ